MMHGFAKAAWALMTARDRGSIRRAASPLMTRRSAGGLSLAKVMMVTAAATRILRAPQSVRMTRPTLARFMGRASHGRLQKPCHESPAAQPRRAFTDAEREGRPYGGRAGTRGRAEGEAGELSFVARS